MGKSGKVYGRIIVMLLVLLAASFLRGEIFSQEKGPLHLDGATSEGGRSAQMAIPASPDALSAASSSGPDRFYFYLPLLFKGFPLNPPGMYSPRMVYEPKVLILLKGGGWDFGWPFWEYDGSSWRHLSPAYMPAFSRPGHVMVYDQARHRVVTGGIRDDYFGETWEYDGDDWQLVAYFPGYIDGAMVYDSARGRSVFFGNWWCVRTACTYFDQTWEYDGSNWTRINTPHSLFPRARLGMAYDTDRQVTVLFGGYGGPSLPAVYYLSDTWEYDGSDWHLITPTFSPSARSSHAMAYDPKRKVTVLFGGVI